MGLLCIAQCIMAGLYYKIKQVQKYLYYGKVQNTCQTITLSNYPSGITKSYIGYHLSTLEPSIRNKAGLYVAR